MALRTIIKEKKHGKIFTISMASSDTTRNERLHRARYSILLMPGSTTHGHCLIRRNCLGFTDKKAARSLD